MYLVIKEKNKKTNSGKIIKYIKFIYFKFKNFVFIFRMIKTGINSKTTIFIDKPVDPIFSMLFDSKKYEVNMPIGTNIKESIRNIFVLPFA